MLGRRKSKKIKKGPELRTKKRENIYVMA